MREAGSDRGEMGGAALAGPDPVLDAMRDALHDLCQPLTALHCRLYLGTMSDEPVQMKSAIDDGLVECDRMVALIRALQDRMKC